jgi:hypothetical protein
MNQHLIAPNLLAPTAPGHGVIVLTLVAAAGQRAPWTTLWEHLPPPACAYTQPGSVVGAFQCETRRDLRREVHCSLVHYARVSFGYLPRQLDNSVNSLHGHAFFTTPPLQEHESDSHSA